MLEDENLLLSVNRAVFCCRSELFVQRFQRNYQQAGFAHKTGGVGRFYPIFLLFFAIVQIMFVLRIGPNWSPIEPPTSRALSPNHYI